MATINAIASRLSGVAPLTVFFETIGVAGISEPPLVLGRREYADFGYTWDFDDTGAGTWAADGKSKNADYGYHAAHVFESAGTYTVTVTIVDGASVNETHDVTITVSDPDTFYSTTNTTCVSTSGDFTGCPAGATQVTSSAFKTTIDTYKGANQRILFKRGESWSESGTVALGTNAGMTIGAYGTGTSPDARGIFTNAPVVAATSTGAIFNADNFTDGVVMDLSFTDAGNTRDYFVRGLSGTDTQLWLRNKSVGFDTPVSMYYFGDTAHDQIAFVDNDISEGRTYCFYCGSERLMVMGNTIRESELSHVTRIWSAYKGVIAHNEMASSSQTSATGRLVLKLHGPEDVDVPSVIANQTQYVIIANNLFGAGNPWPVDVGPVDTGKNCNITDVVVEKNRFYAGHGTLSAASTAYRVPLHMFTSYSTIRNNLFVGEDSANTVYWGVIVERAGIENVPTGNRVYNNTFYKPESGGSIYIGVQVGVDAVNTLVYNNLAVFPADATTRLVVDDNGTTSTLATNLLTTDATMVDPTNVVYLDKDFRLDTGSAAIDAGTAVSIFTDFDDNARTVTTIDQGAFEYGSATTVSLTVAGVWEPGVWATTVWAEGVWDETPPADTTAPILSLPTGIKTGATTASGTVTTDEAGTGYYYASTNASETAATIKASGDSKAFIVGLNSVSFGGLSPSTLYYAHYVEDDAAPNESNVVSSAGFTTDAYVAPKGGGGFISNFGKLGFK